MILLRPILALLVTSLTAAAATVPGRLASCAWLSDGRAAVLLPAGDGLELRFTRLTCPRTLDDFHDRSVLFGKTGSIAPVIPDNALLMVAGDTLQIFFTAGGQVHCASAPFPVEADSQWTGASQALAGNLRLKPVVVPAGHAPAVLILQHEPGKTGSNIARAHLSGRSLVLQEIVPAPDYVADADALIDGAEQLHLAWSEAAPEQPVRYCVFDPAGKPQGEFLTMLDAGQRPVITTDGDGVLLATEAVTGGIKVSRIAHGAVIRSVELGGRMHFRPSFVRDTHGVTWLLALDAGRRAMHYRRLLGREFDVENTAYGVQGRWEHSFDYSLTRRPGETAAGIALLHHEDLPEGGEPRFRFDALPVPRLAVTDNRRVLFLDLLDVASVDNAIQRLGPVAKFDSNPFQLNGPAGSADEAWVNYADVLFDQGRFRMWYTTNTNTFERNWNLAYAESQDGINWTKPNLGLVPYNGSKDNNLLFPNLQDAGKPPEGANAGVGLVNLDEADPDPSRRYKMIFLSSNLEGDATVYLTWSPDGIHWQIPPHRLWGKSEGANRIIRGQTPWVEPLSSFFHDPIEPHPEYRWKIYGIDGYAGHPHMDVSAGRSMGMVHGATPYDFTPYSDNPVIDPRTGVGEDQNHGGLVQVYEGVYVSLYQHWSGPEWSVDLRLAASRDGIHFTRVQPDQPFLARGAPGAWDSGMLCTPNQLITHQDRIWLYYRGSIGTLANGRALSRSNYAPAKNLREPWRIYTGLARFRQDGFTYLTVAPLQRTGLQSRTSFVTDYEVKLEARVRSIPITAAGIGTRTLHVNAGTLAPRFAWIKARLLDPATGSAVSGFDFDDCDPLEEDALDHTLTWRGSSSLAAVQAHRIQVEFLLFGTLDSPRLHSFWFE